MKHDEDCTKTKFPCCEDTMCVCDRDNFERLIAENARLREALEFYAHERCCTMHDREIAREALNDLRKGGE